MISLKALRLIVRTSLPQRSFLKHRRPSLGNQLAAWVSTSAENCKKLDNIAQNINNKKVCNDENVVEPARSAFNPAMEKKKQMILMEIEVFRQSADIVVDFNEEDLKPRDWRDLLELTSPHQRKKYYMYVMKRKIAKDADKRRKERKNAERLEREQEMAEETAGHIQYGLGKNTLYFRIHEAAMTKMHNTRLAHSILHGQKLVFDLDYNGHMRHKDIRSCADQIQLSYGINKRDDDPFSLYFCNARPSEALLPQLQLSCPPLAQPRPLATITAKSYLELFPKEKLVYLTPDCNYDLVEYDQDAVYIIGCFVDMVQNVPLSLAKAKQEGLKMARFPLERYLHFSSGSNKSLTIDQVMRILLIAKNTGDWAAALKHVPRRKLVHKPYIQRGPYRERGESLFGRLT